MDNTTYLSDLKQLVQVMVEERQWSQFHDAKNLSMDIVREASELMEFFVWTSSQESETILNHKKDAICEELADVLIASLTFANHYQLDLSSIIQNKINKIKKKYPIEKSYGSNKKYTEFTK